MKDGVKRKILVTAALPYANGDIHLGHLLEYIQADIWVRFQRIKGNECLFFCADDTHGTPVMLGAQNLKITPEELIAQKKKEHLEDFKNFEIDFTHYSSTNCEINRRLSHDFYQAMKNQGHITIKTIDQIFCENCKMFLPDRFIKGQCSNCLSDDQYGDSCEKCSFIYTPDDLINPYCVTCGQKPILRKSEHVFFELNHFKKFLQNWIKEHVTQEVENKLLEWFQQDLKAWDISRDEPYFGFLIPEYSNKYFYVWVDAPIGYISATQEWIEKNPTLAKAKSHRDYWQNQNYEIYHFIGKDIIYFHSLFWPAMLQCMGYSTPQQVFTHGFLTLNGEKMSKSKKIFINAKDYLKKFSPLYLRYYLASKINPSLNDLDLNLEDFKNKINAELIGKITNLISRSLNLLKNKFNNKLGLMSGEGKKKLAEYWEQEKEIGSNYQKREFVKVIIFVREIAEKSNRYFDEKKPWLKDETDLVSTQQVLTDVINFFRIIVIFLSPILPSYSRQVARLFKEKSYTWLDLFSPLENQVVNEYQHLLKRISDNEIKEWLVKKNKLSSKK